MQIHTNTNTSWTEVVKRREVQAVVENMGDNINIKGLFCYFTFSYHVCFKSHTWKIFKHTNRADRNHTNENH